MSKDDDVKKTEKPKAATAQPEPVPNPRIDPDENGTAKVSLSVYLKQTKTPVDQAAGFELFAKNHGLGCKTPEQWRTLQDKFNRRPI